MEKKRKYYNRVGVVILSIIITLIAIELYLKYQHNQEKQALINKYKNIDKDRGLCTIKSSNRNLIYELAPGICGNNSHGFFDYEYSIEKSENVFRIIVIGDSVAQGQWVEKSQTFSNLLEQYLNDRPGEKKYEVITMAITGYSTSQQLILLENQADKYSPDLIIWSYVLNDPAHPIYHDANGELGRYFYDPKLHIVDFIKKEIFLYQQTKKGKKCEGKYHERLHCVYRNNIKSHIEELGAYSRDKRVPIIFLIHPIFERNKPFTDYSLLSIHQDLSNMSKDQGLIALDLLEPYTPYSTNELGMDPWHPSTSGHKLAAEYLYEYLYENILDNTSSTQ